MKRYLITFVVVIVAALSFAADKPLTVFVFGDTSAAARQTDQTDERGWAQLLPTYFTDMVTVIDLAEEGKSTQLMVSESIWQRQKDQITRGSFVILQFSDYDIKQNNSYAHASIEEYQKNLEQMVKDIKKKGGKAIICTPPARLHYSAETEQLVERHGGYVEAARRVAKANKLPLLDLNERTSIWLSQLSKEDAAAYFIPQGSDGQDNDLRLNEAGALKVAWFAADEIQAKKVKKLSAQLNMYNTDPRYSER